MKEVEKNIQLGREKIDDLARDAFEGYSIEPSSAVWSKIESGFVKPKFGMSNYINYKTILAAATVVGLTTSLLFIDFSNSEIDHNITEEITVSEDMDIETSTIEAAEEANSELSTIVAEKIIEENIITKSESIYIAKSEDFIILEKTDEANESEVELIEEDIVDFTDFSLMNSRYGNQVEINRNELNKLENVDFSELSLKDDYGKRANLRFGLHVTPGYTYYKAQNKRDYFGIDFNINYHFSRFSIQTGLGISRISELGEVGIYYQLNKAVNPYYDLIGYEEDPITGEQIPIYAEELTYSYEWQDRQTSSQRKIEYTYLNVPIIIGYDFASFRNLTLTLKGGTIFSYNIDKKDSEVYFYGNDIRLIGIENNYPDRLRSFWQLYTGLNIKYQLTGNISVSLEPMYKQTINSIYQQELDNYDSRPYSFGLSSGIVFNF